MLPMSLPAVQKKLLEHGVHVSYITLKRRSQDGALNAARRGRKFDFEAVLRLMAEQGQEVTSTGMPKAPADGQRAVARGQAMREQSGALDDSTEALRVLIAGVASQLDVLVPAVQRLEQAMTGLDAVRKMLMVKDDEARSSLRERLDAANAQIEALRHGGGGGGALDVARIQASLARIAGMVERAPWLAN